MCESPISAWEARVPAAKPPVLSGQDLVHLPYNPDIARFGRETAAVRA